MAVADAVNNVLSIVDDVERIDDVLCYVKTEDAGKTLRRLNLPDNCSAVIIPAEILTGPKHLRLVAYLTEKAWLEGTAIARKKEIEFMLTYLATRQIRDALKVFQPGSGSAVLYVWCIGEGAKAQIVKCDPPSTGAGIEDELDAIERTAIFWAEHHR